MMINHFRTILQLFLFLCVLAVFICPSLAEIRHTHIQSDDRTLFYIDAFRFGEIGGLQLNLSHINLLPNPNPNLNLSQVGFFWVSRTKMIHLNMTREGFEGGVCYLQSQFINILYTFDKLDDEKMKDSVDVEFSIKGPDGLQLCFQNCVPQLHVSMDIQSTMYNLENSIYGRRINYFSHGMNWLVGYMFAFMLVLMGKPEVC
ncbi:hypothetical protein ACHQM5_030864 [Ranunculus cassubicifolius]